MRKAVVVLTVALIGASSIASTSALAVDGAFKVEEYRLDKRHGDHGHEEEHQEDMTMAMEGSGMDHTAAGASLIQSESTSGAVQHSHEHTHDHGDKPHNHHHMPNPYDSIPDPLSQDINTFIPIPQLPKGAGGHSHGGHGEPKVDLNETLILRSKGPDPLSYIEWDFAYGMGTSETLLRFAIAAEKDGSSPVMGVSGNRYRTLLDERDESKRIEIASDIKNRVLESAQDPGRHRILLILHVVGCIISCFVLLPLALALRAAESNLAPLASLVYLISLMGSLFMSQIYKAMTPQLYPSNSHSGLGYAIFWISLLVLGGDIFKLFKRIVFSLHGSSKKMTLKRLIQTVTFSSQSTRNHEYNALKEERMLSEAEHRDHSSDSSNTHHVHFANQQFRQGKRTPRPFSAASSSSSSTARNDSADMSSPTSTLCNTPRTSLLGEPLFPWRHSMSNKEGQSTTIAQDRLASWKQFNDEQHSSLPKVKKIKSTKQIFTSILRYSHVIVARSLPILSFVASYTGLAVYTGSCRGPYKNVCLAHGIKGGIFFWYGLFSFARYMGAYADIGWAWNKRPSSRKSSSSSSGISAEWVECFVIFFYGITNTWMERFGAKTGDPYTVKQVQHISIAVMFWFAGIIGMILETKSLKNLLALPVSLKQSSISARDSTTADEATCEEAISLPARPPSYNFSFNPFPALVIGVTGVAMAAHHQDYVYEVSIHMLWGNLLAGFSIFRILTYFFLFLRPPTSSIMPSRPPTEALASFCLTAGGLVFILSSEEVSFAALRSGFGDMMMILNLTVAIVCFLFCGIATLMIVKAYAVKLQRQINQVQQVHLDDGDEEERKSRSSESRSVFVLQNDDDEEQQQAQDQANNRQLSSSPLTV